MNELEKENLRLKLTLISMIRQFYNYEITHEKANKYSVKYSENDELGEFVQCYFHMFESSGEHAWKMLGLTNAIVNAIRKFESAGVIESRSSGMKGTYIKVLNDVALDEIKKIQLERG